MDEPLLVRRYVVSELDTAYTQQPVRFTYSMLEDLMRRVEDDYRSGRHFERERALAEFLRNDVDQMLARLKKTNPEVSYG